MDKKKRSKKNFLSIPLDVKTISMIIVTVLMFVSTPQNVMAASVTPGTWTFSGDTFSSYNIISNKKFTANLKYTESYVYGEATMKGLSLIKGHNYKITFDYDVVWEEKENIQDEIVAQVSLGSEKSTSKQSGKTITIDDIENSTENYSETLFFAGGSSPEIDIDFYIESASQSGSWSTKVTITNFNITDEGLNYNYVAGLNNDISKCTITGVKTSYVYTGKAIKPSVRITNKGLKVNKNDYSVSYKYNKKCGIAKVTITGKNNYTGTKTISFKIKPKKVTGLVAKSKSKGGLTVTWKKCKSISGYQAQLATSKSKIKTAKVQEFDAKKQGFSFRQGALKSGTEYYVRVRAFYKVGANKYVYGKWSSIKGIKIK